MLSILRSCTKWTTTYYLTILVDIEGRPKRYPAWLLALMREHAEDTDVTRAVLQEHGYLLLVNEAVASLKRLNAYDSLPFKIHFGVAWNLFHRCDSHAFGASIGI